MFVLVATLPATTCIANYDRLTIAMSILIFTSGAFYGCMCAFTSMAHANFNSFPHGSACILLTIWGMNVGAMALAGSYCTNNNNNNNTSYVIGYVNFVLPMVLGVTDLYCASSSDNNE